jgi:hypothetical protein
LIYAGHKAAKGADMLRINLGDIIEFINYILNSIFGEQVPAWISTAVGYFLLAAFALLILWGFLFVLSKIMQLWAEHFSPLFYDAEKKRRRVRRGRFAEHIEDEIKRLGRLEEWSDYRFAELEAEVEAEGRRRILGIFPFRNRTQGGLRHERSLSEALATSDERLILIEGEPGSGKSVALRHVTQKMAKRATQARRIDCVIPIYINLKELERAEEKPVDRELIYSFVLKTLNRVNDRDIEEFLEEEFDQGIRDGTWLFLFDSFDEIPEVLSATEADEVVSSYAEAIYDFLHGMNQCRGVVASRQFRGPGQFGWPRFRILPLTDARRIELVHRADLEPRLEQEFIGQLGLATPEIRSMSNNPMFLSLLCDHARTGQSFPENAHVVFETYVETRLIRDRERLERRYGISPESVRETAEHIAFCMAADSGLGLSPTRENLAGAMVRQGFGVDGLFESHLDALEYIKLARAETATAVGDSKPFTFAHRRFQEYFATCVVLREPERVSPRELLTDARWRETAVVMCQTQPRKVLEPIIDEAQLILEEMVGSVQELVDAASGVYADGVDENEEPPPEPFPWPSGALHILGLLQDGFGRRLDIMPDDVQRCAEALVLSASKMGTLWDKKWGLEVAGIVPPSTLVRLLQDAFASKSQWLKEVAYRQVAWLRKIPADIAGSICRAIVDLFIDGRLRRDRHTIHAHLARLDQSAHFLSVARLLLWIPIIDIGLYFLLGLMALIGIFEHLSSLEVGTLFFLSIVVGGAALLTPYLSLVLYRWYWGAPEDWLEAYVGLYGLRILWLYPCTFSIDTSLYFGMLFLFVLTWMPFALFSARRGFLVQPYWWLLVPISPILYVLTKGNLKVIVTSIGKHWKDVGKVIGIVLLVVLLVVGTMAGITKAFLWLTGQVIWEMQCFQVGIFALFLWGFSLYAYG